MHASQHPYHHHKQHQPLRSTILHHPAPQSYLTHSAQHNTTSWNTIKTSTTTLQNTQMQIPIPSWLGFSATSFWPLRGTSMLELRPVARSIQSIQSANWTWSPVWSGQPSTEKGKKKKRNTERKTSQHKISTKQNAKQQTNNVKRQKHSWVPPASTILGLATLVFPLKGGDGSMWGWLLLSLFVSINQSKQLHQQYNINFSIINNNQIYTHAHIYIYILIYIQKKSSTYGDWQCVTD